MKATIYILIYIIKKDLKSDLDYFRNFIKTSLVYAVYLYPHVNIYDDSLASRTQAQHYIFFFL